ncbi:MAG: hypothetical protein ABSB76_32210 [Streptosporangiaceae bacterium]|jgi:hypothetical protein
MTCSDHAVSQQFPDQAFAAQISQPVFPQTRPGSYQARQARPAARFRQPVATPASRNSRRHRNEHGKIRR